MLNIFNMKNPSSCPNHKYFKMESDKVKTVGEGRRGARWEKVTFALDFLALNGLNNEKITL